MRMTKWRHSLKFTHKLRSYEYICKYLFLSIPHNLIRYLSQWSKENNKNDSLCSLRKRWNGISIKIPLSTHRSWMHHKSQLNRPFRWTLKCMRPRSLLWTFLMNIILWLSRTKAACSALDWVNGANGSGNNSRWPVNFNSNRNGRNNRVVIFYWIECACQKERCSSSEQWRKLKLDSCSWLQTKWIRLRIQSESAGNVA